MPSVLCVSTVYTINLYNELSLKFPLYMCFSSFIPVNKATTVVFANYR